MLKTALIAACLAAPSMALAEPINLVCKGIGTWTESEYESGTVRAFRGNQTAYGIVDGTTTRKQSGEVQIRVEFADETSGRIKMPRELTPPLHTGAKDGWWPLAEVDMGADLIRGQFKLNVLNRAKLVIDRHTGEMDLNALGGGFNGTCERALDASEERKF